MTSAMAFTPGAALLGAKARPASFKALMSPELSPMYAISDNGIPVTREIHFKPFPLLHTLRITFTDISV